MKKILNKKQTAEFRQRSKDILTILSGKSDELIEHNQDLNDMKTELLDLMCLLEVEDFNQFATELGFSKT